MKVKFLLLASLNLLISNLILQILLLIKLIPVIFSTLIFILINTVLGFILFGRYLFNKKDIFKKSYMTKYLLLLIFSWLTLSFGIFLGSKLNFSANLTSIFLIPPIGFNSYLIQKYWVFK